MDIVLDDDAPLPPSHRVAMSGGQIHGRVIRERATRRDGGDGGSG